MLELGTRAPYFELPDFNGRYVSLSESEVGKAPATVIVFMCNHCPYVINLKEHFSEAARQWQEQGVKIFAINSNNWKSYPMDAPEQMAKDALRYNYTFPYLVDETQEIAKAYRAACTPDFYLFDRDLRLVYRGQYDNSRPSNDTPVTGSDLGTAIDAMLTNKSVPQNQKPSLGCNIKWRKDNQPRYY